MHFDSSKANRFSFVLFTPLAQQIILKPPYFVVKSSYKLSLKWVFRTFYTLNIHKTPKTPHKSPELNLSVIIFPYSSIFIENTLKFLSNLLCRYYQS